MFEKNLTDLIRGLRANKKNEAKYIATCVEEIRRELKGNDPDLKAIAVSKLTYLQMLGFDMSWASFQVVEVMASSKFVNKRIGYLAAAQSFRQDTEVLMLTTNLIKKDLASSNYLEVGITIDGLSHILTPDLARDLSSDLIAMLTHSRPYIRKKVILVLYKVFLKFPEGLRFSFPRLKERLDDPDPSVVCASINVICELARMNPKNYLSLAPQLFKLLTTSSNNWMLIKIIKLFAALTPLEPRLAKKLVTPIKSLIQTTPAMSLLYECIQTVISGGMLTLNSDSGEASGPNDVALAALCASKLKKFLEDPDQNLKYVGLLAMGKLLSIYPKAVVEHRDLILNCVEDSDISIRLRALDLIVGMTSKKTLMDIVKRLMTQLMPPPVPTATFPATTAFHDPSYRKIIVDRILSICSHNSYSNITNFEWYIAVLVDLVYISEVNVGSQLSAQIMDVGVRVKSVRQYCVKMMSRLLSDIGLLESTGRAESNSDILYGAAWICGEYCNYLSSASNTIKALLKPEALKLPCSVQQIYLHNVLKIYAYWIKQVAENWHHDSWKELCDTTNAVIELIHPFCQSDDLEVQERAYSAREIFKIVHSKMSTFTDKPSSIFLDLSELFFSAELNPVAPKAQRKVPVPEGLDIDEWINEPLLESESEEEVDEYSENGFFGESGHTSSKKKQVPISENPEIQEKRRAQRVAKMRNDPFYISTEANSLPSSPVSDLDIDSIPIVELTLNEKPNLQSDGFVKKGKKKTSKKKNRSPSPELAPIVFQPEEMPEDAVGSGSDDDMNTIKPVAKTGILDHDFSGLLSVDLSKPLGVDEKPPQLAAYASPDESRRIAETKMLKKKSKAVKDKASKSKSSEKKSKKSKKNADSIIPQSDDLINLDSESKPIKKTKKKSKSQSSKSQGEEMKSAVEIPTEVNASEFTSISNNEAKPEEHFVLAEDDNVSIKHEVYCSSAENSQTLLGTFIPALSIVLVLHHKSSDSIPLSSMELSLTPSSNLRYEHLNEQHILPISETLTSGDDKKLTLSALVLDEEYTELSIQGSFFYAKQHEDETISRHSVDFECNIPLSVFMTPTEPISPEVFSNCLTNFEDFQYAATTSFIVKNGSTDEDFENALNTITQKSGTHIVEHIPGASSIYGKAVQGFQIAGLVKLNRHTNEGMELSLQLKSSNEQFISGLVNEIEKLFY
ncbi:AP-3 complex subunit delta [Basidiobolus ranarum]|uniref:AP-3 complex subunit delta n=1 Tax=Basidiobolus ranarum TaxID=34480 RepID=A0ABR2WM44_9FUNG